ncbi:protein ENHANCED PSEUDOMONAS SUSCEPTIBILTY 1-like [Papaver somniferum]|uniref:protein ENHANCED PSEUDOMONAS SUSCEPTIBILTY 1-like n=1 Tax=Papaver somniferum TaxID=3469 RepID=UPI000E6F8FD3|nr:protein ENHANCED PSEUDOMONAS SUSCEPTIBILTY 1-like [Papaver somniferum]
MLISSLQAVLAHVWITVTRARRSLDVNYNENEETLFGFMMSNRTKFIPPLSETYFGNSITFGMLTEKDEEVLTRGSGFLASLFKEVVNSHCDEKIKSSIKSWIQKPFIITSSGVANKNLVARNSHRFNMYGNDFGWGRPIAIKTGRNGKSSGITNVSPGPVEGSIDIEIFLPIEVFQAMENDVEFMEAF